MALYILTRSFRANGVATMIALLTAHSGLSKKLDLKIDKPKRDVVDFLKQLNSMLYTKYKIFRIIFY